MKNALSEQLKELLANIPEPKRQDLLCAELLNKIKVCQFKEKPQSIVWKTIGEVIFLCFSPWSAAPALRTAAYFFIGILVCVTAVAGARIAGPGDSLYSVKISMERIPLAMPMVSEETKFDVEIKSAKKRQDEIVEIIASDASAEDKSRKIEEAGKELTRTITSTEKRVREMRQRPNRVAAAGAAASSLKVSVGEIKQTIDKAMGNRDKANSPENSEKIANTLEKIYAAASVVELSSLEVMVEAVADDEPKQEEASSDGSIQKQQEGPENEGEGKEVASAPESSDAQELPKNELKEEAQPKTSAEQEPEQMTATDEGKETVGAAQEQGVDKNQVEEELKNAIVDLRARVEEVSSSEQDKAAETAPQDGAEDALQTGQTTAEATFDVAETLRLEAQQEKIQETEEAIESAEAALAQGDFKGAMEFIKKGEALWITH